MCWFASLCVTTGFHCVLIIQIRHDTLYRNTHGSVFKYITYLIDYHITSWEYIITNIVKATRQCSPNNSCPHKSTAWVYQRPGAIGSWRNHSTTQDILITLLVLPLYVISSHDWKLWSTIRLITHKLVVCVQRYLSCQRETHLSIDEKRFATRQHSPSRHLVMITYTFPESLSQNSVWFTYTDAITITIIIH